jgi:hypothetical protein
MGTFRKSLYIIRGFLHVIPGRGCPEGHSGAVASLVPIGRGLEKNPTGSSRGRIGGWGMRYSEKDTERIGLPTIYYSPARAGEAPISSIVIPMITTVHSRQLPSACLIR